MFYSETFFTQSFWLNFIFVYTILQRMFIIFQICSGYIFFAVHFFNENFTFEIAFDRFSCDVIPTLKGHPHGRRIATTRRFIVRLRYAHETRF